jgi:hypothetical protein
MTKTAVLQRGSEQTSDQNAIRPIQVDIPEPELAELHRRINATNWPERQTATDASQGVQFATIQALAQDRSKGEHLAAVHNRNRWARHSFHSRLFEA